MAAARQNEMNVRSAVVATMTRGTPAPRLPAAAGGLEIVLMNGSIYPRPKSSHFSQMKSSVRGGAERIKNRLFGEITKGRGAIGARADGAEVLVAEDAGVVAVVEIDLHGVIADLRGGLGANFGFEHGQGRRRNGRGLGCGVLLFLVALLVAGGAGA